MRPVLPGTIAVVRDRGPSVEGVLHCRRRLLGVTSSLDRSTRQTQPSTKTAIRVRENEVGPHAALAGRYRQFKENDYEVLPVARDVATEEPVVVYQPLCGERGHRIWTLADFTAHVSRDGYDGPRFVRTSGAG